PHRLVVGAGLVGQEPRRAAVAQERERVLAHVGLEAAAADAARSRALRLDEKFRARPAIGRAADLDDRRQRRRLLQRSDALEQGQCLAPALHSGFRLRLHTEPDWPAPRARGYREALPGGMAGSAGLPTTRLRPAPPPARA